MFLSARLLATKEHHQTRENAIRPFGSVTVLESPASKAESLPCSLRVLDLGPPWHYRCSNTFATCTVAARPGAKRRFRPRSGLTLQRCTPQRSQLCPPSL